MVLVFDSQGIEKGSFAEHGEEEGQISHPYALGVNAHGRVFVADQAHLGVQEFDPDGNYLRHILLPTAAQEALNRQLRRHGEGREGGSADNAGHKEKREADADTWAQVGGLTTDNTDLYVTNRPDNRVLKFTARGQKRYSLGGFGAGDAQFDGPKGLVVLPSGNLWVVDTENSRLEEFGTAMGVTPSPTAVAGAGVEINGLSAQPNPFNPSLGGLASIAYNLSPSADVAVAISDSLGRGVFSANFSAGSQGGLLGLNQLTWNGHDLAGGLVPAGAYVIVVTASKNGSTASLSTGIQVVAASGPVPTFTPVVGITPLPTNTPIPTSTPVPSVSGLHVTANPPEHNDPVTISYMLSSRASVTVTVVDKHGNVDFSAVFAPGSSGGAAGSNSVVMPHAGPPGLSPYTVTVIVSGGNSQSLQFNSTP
jgi:hypothetical protein